jgi:hypothetical protein
MARTACPFCFRKVDTSRLAFQCTNRGNQTCALETDEKRMTIAESSALSYKTFTVGSEHKGDEATCPSCGGVCTRRACPECHTAVPIDFVDSDSPMVGIVGSKNAGKTVWMTILVKQLREEIGRQFGAAVRMATDAADSSDTPEAYKKDREDSLFEAGNLPGGTDQNSVQRRRSVVMQWQGTRANLLGRQTPHTTLLSFVDSAGEDLNSLADTFTLRYLTVCDGLVVALDPFALPGARARITLPESAYGDASDPLQVIERITELLRVELKVKKNKKIKLPVAIVFTKIDAFFPTMAPGNPVMRTTPKQPAYAEGDGLEVHEHMRALLHDWRADDIDRHLAFNCADFRFFGVSALGAEPNYDARQVAAGGVRPHRTADPLLWLLAKEKAVTKA